MRRQAVAAGLIRAVHDAERESQAVGSALPLQREAILRCREDLVALATRVGSPEPAPWLGLMLANELLTDVDSPLYQGSGDLPAATRKALAALGPASGA
jgi:hypothetical protein